MQRLRAVLAPVVGGALLAFAAILFANSPPPPKSTDSEAARKNLRAEPRSAVTLPGIPRPRSRCPGGGKRGNRFRASNPIVSAAI